MPTENERRTPSLQDEFVAAVDATEGSSEESADDEVRDQKTD